MSRICICTNMGIISANGLPNVKLIGLCCLIHATVGLYFTQDWYKIYVLSNEPAGTKIGHVFLLRNDNDAKCNLTIINESVNNQSISIDMDTFGKMNITTAKNHTEGAEIHVKASCQNSVSLSKAETNISIIAVSGLPQDVQSTDKMCFGDVASTFTIEENSGPQCLGILCPRCHLLRVDLQPIYSLHFAHILSDNQLGEYLTMENNTTKLCLMKSLDREEHHSPVILTVTCTSNGVIHKRNFTLIVSDVNDNGPYFAKKDGYRKQFLERYVSIDEQVKQFIEDNDTMMKNHTVRITYDPLGVCELKNKAQLICMNVVTKKESIGVLCSFVVIFNKSRFLSSKGDVYICNVTLEDTTLKSAANTPAKIILQIYIYREPVTVIPRFATEFARVHQFRGGSTGDMETYRSSSNIFGITHTGILYVKDVLRFRALSSLIKINVTKLSNKKETNKTLLIKIVGDNNTLNGQSVDWGCGQYNSENKCLQSQGMGSSTHHCQWRNEMKRVNALALIYSTCSPSLKTCPNKICDELEELSPHICPQDCALKNKLFGELISNDVRGIAMANGPCVCNYNSCSCNGSHKDKSNDVIRAQTATKQYTSTSSASKAEKSTETNNTMMIAQPKADLQFAKEVTCDEECRTTVAAAIGCGLAAVVVTAIVWFIRRHRCGRHNALKHVGSAVSVSALPSDYVDDRDRQVPHTTHSSPPSWSPKGPPLLAQEDIDKKWEFSRDNLILEGALGEGEFGQVIQARAFGIDGKQEYRTVAIKMLKNCAAQCERQDLMSELNLLKDVNHPNVIRLLGSCTYGGPLYIIVEYCEDGSLLSFLRQSRLQEADYEKHRFRHRHHAGKRPEDKTEIEILTIADLLSFAWQIARGMQYLSDMKLVHRDLAARNVLVASGKLLKISDFGLTRDVYEADTYLKKSKGRIPVKWLAPESLYARIYTTHSDVWSYGIVLWELCTLGAPPYPGIPPERLYNLLIGGYRMDRPEYCTDEMYAVMQKCWKCGSNDRPTFAELVDIFDGILEERTVYLDLDTGRERRVLSDDLLNMESNISTMDTSMDSRQPCMRSDSEIGYGSISTYDKNDTHVTPATDEEDVPLAPLLPDEDEDGERSKWEESSDSEKLALLFDTCSAQFSNVCSEKNSERYGGTELHV